MEDNNKDTDKSTSSINNDKEELFDYIYNLDDNNIKKILSYKDLPIWEYRSEENKNSSLLIVSTYKTSFKITQILINYCIDHNKEKLKEFINAPNDQGICPIHYASFRGDVEIIKLLIENGADITKTTNRKLNVIHYCAQGNKPNSLMFFYFKLKRENTNSTEQYKLITDIDEGGSTPLHWAVYSLAEDFLLYLIKLDIFKSEEERFNFLNQKDEQEYTPLHLCISSKSPRIAMKLLQNGADPSLLDKKGQSPLDAAKKKNLEELKQILENSQSTQCCNIKAPVRQIKKSYKNIICVFFFQILATMIMFCSILPIFLYKYDSILGAILFYCYSSLLLIFFIIYILLLKINPGIKEANSLEYLENEILDKKKDLTKYCYKCFIKKTTTSKHCIICDRCYEDFDHHCYWINKCVAKNNYKLFIVFLIEISFYLSIMLAICILSIIKISFLRSNDQSESTSICDNYLARFDKTFLIEKCEFIFKNKFILHLILNILLILIVLSFLIPEFLLLILHIHVCYSNYREIKNRNETSSFSTYSIINEEDNNLLLSNTPSKS